MAIGRGTKRKIMVGLAFIIILGFCFKLYNDANLLKKEKSQLIDQLQKSKDSLDISITENSEIKTQLQVEKQKLENLISDVANSASSLKVIEEYKLELKQLRAQVDFLKKENLKLVDKYQKLKNHSDSTEVALNRSQNKETELLEKNANIASMVKRSAKLVYANLKVSPTLNGKEIFKANKINMLKFSFVVLENKLATPKKKEYYVQVIDPKSNVIGKRLSKKFGPKILDYSFSSIFEYDRNFIDVATNLSISNLIPGDYTVNIFDQDESVLKYSFTLN